MYTLNFSLHILITITTTLTMPTRPNLYTSYMLATLRYAGGICISPCANHINTPDPYPVPSTIDI